MTPEEIINKQTWEILQDIKEESLAPEEDGTFFYDTTIIVIGAGENSPSRERKIALVRKLAKDEKAVEVVKEIPPDWRGGRNGFYLKLLQPQFNKVYEKYKKACDLTSYLNDYQNKLLKGDNLSEFLHIDDKEPTKKTSSIRHRSKMFETGSGGGYYNRSHPIRPMKKQSANEIVNGFSSSNYAFVLMVSEGILSASEFGSDGEVNYRLQSAPGQMLMQERQLLSKFEKLGLFRNLGEDDIFAIATLRDVDTEIIRQIATEIKSRQSNLQTKPEGKNGDLKTRYNRLLDEITSKQKPSDLEKRYKQPINETKEINGSIISSQKNTQKHKELTLPSGWRLSEQNNIPQIKKDGVVVFSFQNNWSGKYRYFKCLWENYGVKKSYKEIYEFESKLKYPEKNIWRINRNMRNTINKLRKEFKNKNQPLYIETNKGFTLTIF